VKALVRVLLRAVGLAFFQAYAGWLTGVGLLVGGVMSNREHAMLIRAALTDSRILVAIYLLPWALYTLVSVRFATRLWATAVYEPLRVLRLVPPARRWAVGLLTQSLVLAPCWLYGAVIGVFAIHHHAWGTLLVVGLTLSGLTVAGWTAHERALRGSAPPSWLTQRLRLLDRPLPPALWWLRARTGRRPWSLLALKAVSVGVVWGICQVYSPASYDARLLTLGALLTAALHGLVPAEVQAWEREHLPLLRNLPVGLGRRWLGYALLFSALLLPEAVAWARWCPLTGATRWIAALRLWLFPGAALLLLWAAGLRWPIRPPQALGRVLAGSFGGYFCLLLKVPLDLLTVAALVGSGWLTARYYWQAEEPQQHQQ
jgi:hypothetical protein